MAPGRTRSQVNNRFRNCVIRSVVGHGGTELDQVAREDVGQVYPTSEPQSMISSSAVIAF